MSRAAISAAIQAKISAVDATGKVHGYVRWAPEWEQFLTLFKTSGSVIRGWTVSREATPTRQITGGEVEKAHVFVIRGILGLKDASATETQFQALLDSLQDAFLADDRLGGACDTLSPDWGPLAGAVGLQISTVETRMFGSVLCHFGELRLCAVETQAV